MSTVNEMVEFDKLAAGIASIQEKGNFLPNMETKEGYEASKRFVLDFTTPTRTKLDEVHKNAKAYWVKGGKSIDKKKNEIMDLLVDIQKPHQEAYKAFDQAEKDKKLKFESDLQDKINKFYDFKFMVDINVTTSEEITSIIDSCGEIDTVEGFYHRAKDAEITKQETMVILNDCLMSIASREAEQAKQAELAEENRLRQIQIDEQQEAMRLQQEEMDRKQAEFDRIENEAKEKAQSEADEKKCLIDEAAQAELEKKQAIEREEQAKQAVIEREQYAKQQANLAAEQAIKDEQIKQQKIIDDQKAIDEKRANNNRHVTKIKKQAKESLIAIGLSADDAVKVVQALSGKTIKNCSINY